MAQRAPLSHFGPFPLRVGGLLLLSFGALSQAACSRQSSPEVEAPKAEAVSEKIAHLELEGQSGDLGKEVSSRRVGDLSVHRFTGSFRNDVLILSEEVISSDVGLLTILFTLEEGDSKTELMVEMTSGSERVIRVAKVIDGRPIAATKEDFERMLARTSFIPDENAGRIASKNETCLVGKKELDCEITEYKIRVGEEEARLSVARNSRLERDIAGEITAVDGTILYHAELIELRNAAPSSKTGESVALIDAQN